MRRCLVVLACLFVATSTRAVWDKFSPFEPGKPPRPFPLNKLMFESPAQQTRFQQRYDFKPSAADSTCLRVEWDDNYECRVFLPPFDRQIVYPVFAIAGSVICGPEASSADLNQDGIPDYLIVTHSGGNGLAAQYTYVTFLLSSPVGYVKKSVVSFDAEVTDLIVTGHRRAAFVHCMCVWGDHGKDGRAHNYWVYNLLGFSGTNLISANATDRRFPKWVMYAWEPNHTETRQLTGEQRKRQWLAAWDWESNVHRGEFIFPNIEAFADEQMKNAPR